LNTIFIVNYKHLERTPYSIVYKTNRTMNIFKTPRVPSSDRKNTQKPDNNGKQLRPEDFPDLCNKPTVYNNNEESLRYKNVASKKTEESPIENATEYVLPPGWVKIDKLHNVFSKEKDEDLESESDYHAMASQVFQSLVHKWEHERIKYNLLHGDGEYERLYYIPNYNYNVDEYIENDYDEYDEDNEM